MSASLEKSRSTKAIGKIPINAEIKAILTVAQAFQPVRHAGLACGHLKTATFPTHH